ncbi:E3 ubiquitin-protein ligase RNF25 [Nilaparvata lugens]|uniref:E3 ubiquitin-protein ligase RNF25 n=1 Tax=Nilaparvata lugens TaxID=108931 RepID=UPI00193DB3EB|nr:E3 ubiquitin-protein ligase RNF25 [Nilaparvata lugens]
MHEDERVVEELEALKAILMDEIIIKTDDRGYAVGLETDVLPYTALDVDQQFVRITLDIILPTGYPDRSPAVSLRNPRGLDDSTLDALKQQITDKCNEYLGQPVIFEIIEVAKENLTASNVPCCECCICLYGFRDGDQFTKTQCYHYLHTYCLHKHLDASLAAFHDQQASLPLWQRTQRFQAVCPVCRAPITYAAGDLSGAAPPQEVEEAPRKFEPTAELRRLQKDMAALYLRQKQQGGIIVEQDNTITLVTVSSMPSMQSADNLCSGRPVGGGSAPGGGGGTAQVRADRRVAPPPEDMAALYLRQKQQGGIIVEQDNTITLVTVTLLILLIVFYYVVLQAVCPVCRAPITYAAGDLSGAAPPQEVEEAPRKFEPTAELRRLQKDMAALYLRQKQQGGIIVEQDNTITLVTDSSQNAAANR